MKIIISVLFVFCSQLVFSQTPTLKLGSDVWPPFTGNVNEKKVALDLVQHALNEIKINAEFNVTTFDSVMKNINSGKFDGSAAIWKTPERESKLIFSEPYLQNQLVLVGRKGTNVNLYTTDGLRSKKIGLVSSYAYDKTFLDASDLKLTFSNSDQENLNKLLSGEVDYILVDELLIQYLLKYQSQDVSTHLEISTRAFQTKPLYFAINKSVPDAEKIMKDFNKEIKKMMRNGTYNRILDIDWIQTDVDDDGKADIVFRGNAVGTNAPNEVYTLSDNPGDKALPPSSYFIDGNKYDTWESVPDNYKKIELSPTQDEYIPAIHFKF